MRYAVGIDMGGTNIAAGIVDTDGQIVGRGSVRTQQSGSPEALCAQLAQATQLALKNAECDSEAVCGIGVGCPAPVDPEAGRLRFCTNLPQLSAYPICETLQSLTGLPVYLGNDADAAAWGEYKAGALRGYPNSLTITLGTGVGSGVLLDGQLFHGSGGAGAELGHMVIERNGRPCSCGRRGCWEAYASKRGLIETTRQVMEAYPQSLMWEMSGGHIGGRLAFDAMRAGDPAGAAAVDAYINDLACGLLNCINIFQPEAICIGGGLSNEGDFLLGPLQKKNGRQHRRPLWPSAGSFVPGLAWQRCRDYWRGAAGSGGNRAACPLKAAARPMQRFQLCSLPNVHRFRWAAALPVDFPLCQAFCKFIVIF